MLLVDGVLMRGCVLRALLVACLDWCFAYLFGLFDDFDGLFGDLYLLSCWIYR